MRKKKKRCLESYFIILYLEETNQNEVRGVGGVWNKGRKKAPKSKKQKRKKIITTWDPSEY